MKKYCLTEQELLLVEKAINPELRLGIMYAVNLVLKFKELGYFKQEKEQKK